MNIQFVDNQRVKLSDILSSAFLESKRAKFAVAFAKHSGFRIIEPSLVNCLRKDGYVEFLVGLDFHTTDAQALQSFATLAQSFLNFKFYCYSDPSDGTAVYHPKLYLFETDTILRSIIGSSNLTKGGLSDNIEINVMLDLETDGENAENIRDIYAQLKYQPALFAPDQDYIETYGEILEKAKRPGYRRTDTKKAIDRLRETEQDLPKPFTNPSNLQGWQKLVFSKLPNNEFETGELYKFAAEFTLTYPENKNIEPKIRQVLQQLRDLGIILHLEEGRWKKHNTSISKDT